MNARRRLYSEHKYVTFRISEFSRLVAKTNFADNHCIDEVMEKFAGVKSLMHGHAEHENTRIHPLLKENESSLIEKIELDHARHFTSFKKLDELLGLAKSSVNEAIKISAGSDFHREFSLLEAENLLHQHFEETAIMDELLNLYSDEVI